VLAGVVLITGSVAAGLGPIAMVCGVLMLWSGIVKVVVLRIWHGTLNSNSAPDDASVSVDPGTAIGRRS
jgi:hypothetical protein